MQPVRGTHDLLFEDAKKHQLVIDVARAIGTRFGFDEIQTPIFEFSSVFSRTLGDTSDVVTKEMYTFTDKGGDQLSLRPEGTAGVVRSFISNELKRSLPLKFFYQGPMFRYERPQKGRFRQFHQLGIELLGVENTQSDIEVISYANILLQELDILNLTYLEINSIGDKESRQAFRTRLVEFFTKYENDLSEDSKRRLQLNPLRILDSKDKKDIEISQTAPKFEDSLNDISKSKFAEIRNGLDNLGIKYNLNPKLVRGLDYYNHLVFEFKTTALGAQDAVLSGGRYDDLVEMMGGDATFGVGWAAGIERLCLLTQKASAKPRPIALIPLGEKAEKYAILLAHQMRALGIPVEAAYAGNMSNRMKKATRVNSQFAVIIGDQELESQQLGFKNLDTGEQSKITEAELLSRFKSAHQ
ncbi:MAG: histidine--tRNA ligase [Bdellovibrionota bacterium]